MLRQMFEEIGAFRQNGFVEIEIVRVEGGHMPQPQEEEHPRQAALIPGEILGGHGGLGQLQEIRRNRQN